MMNTKVFLLLLLCLPLAGCKQQAEGEKHYDADEGSVDVRESVHDLDVLTEEMEISNFGVPYILNGYLIISDYNSPDKLIHVFDKDDFHYLTSIGNRGPGPDDITNMGKIVTDSQSNSFYVIDHGKHYVLKFPMDSVLSNPACRPERKTAFSNQEFPMNFQYISDTLCYSLFMQPISDSDYRPVPARWNMQTGDISFMSYAGHPEIKRKRVSLAASVEHGIYVEAYWYHDLLTICSLDGNLKNVSYGRRWNNKTSNKDSYYDNVLFCRDKIVASYLGGTRVSNRGGGVHVNYPTRLLIFDVEGKHLGTLNVGRPIIAMCHDSEKHRLIFAFDDEGQFGYLDLDGLI